MAEEHALEEIKGEEEPQPQTMRIFDGQADALKAANADLQAKCDKLEAEKTELQEKYDALQTDHNAMVAALPPAVRKNLKKKDEYVYGDDECRPVPRNGVCEHCGWSMDPANPKHSEPHPIAY